MRSTAARATVWLAAGLLGCGLVTLARSASAPVSASALQSPPPAQGDEQQARATCGGCHAFPPPDILPRQVWRDEFVRMMFIREKRLPPLGPPGVVNRTVQLPPDMEQALPFFTSSRAGASARPGAWPAVSESPIQFTRRGLSLPDMPGHPRCRTCSWCISAVTSSSVCSRPTCASASCSRAARPETVRR